VWATFQGIQIDTKLAAIQKLQALGISSEQKWWSDMEFFAHRLKSGRIEHTTITVRVLPNKPLRLCFMRMEPSPDDSCDVQMSKNALPETCSVLEPLFTDTTPSKEQGENSKCCPPLPQALSINGDLTLGIPHSRLLSRNWRCIGVERPSADK